MSAVCRVPNSVVQAAKAGIKTWWTALTTRSDGSPISICCNMDNTRELRISFYRDRRHKEKKPVMMAVMKGLQGGVEKQEKQQKWGYLSFRKKNIRDDVSDVPCFLALTVQFTLPATRSSDSRLPSSEYRAKSNESKWSSRSKNLVFGWWGAALSLEVARVGEIIPQSRELSACFQQFRVKLQGRENVLVP
ncbi:hypothetical protein INR49_032912 [Caranx melampygus]|nr:hypothetical protein INR49_032912 [Caranx melampygus]